MAIASRAYVGWKAVRPLRRENRKLPIRAEHVCVQSVVSLVSISPEGVARRHHSFSYLQLRRLAGPHACVLLLDFLEARSSFRGPGELGRSDEQSLIFDFSLPRTVRPFNGPIPRIAAGDLSGIGIRLVLFGSRFRPQE